MTRDEPSKPSNPPDGDRRIQQVKEFYKLADEVHSGFADPDREELQRRDWARKRLTRMLQEHPVATKSLSEDDPHRWILDVINDLADYMRSERLFVVHECLMETYAVIEELLASEGPGGSPDNPAEPDDPE